MAKLAFEGFLVDTDRRVLLRNGVQVDLQPLVFDLVSFLAKRPRRVVSKAELLPAIWRTSFVTETVVARAVMKARRALLDDARAPRLLRTVPRLGYLFDAEVSEYGSKKEDDPDTTACVVVSGPRLALLPVQDRTGNPALSWVSAGLAGLIQQWIEDMGGFRPVLATEAQIASCIELHDSGTHAPLGPRLGVVDVVRSELSWHGQVFVLRAWRGMEAPGILTFEEHGGDVIRLARRMAQTLTGERVLDEPAHVDSFWLEQLAIVVSLRQAGSPGRALSLLESCRLHLPETLSVRLLHVRLLIQSGCHLEAIERADLALADPALPERSLTRVELLSLRAQGAFEADRVAEARAFFDDALRLSAQVPGAQTLRPDILGKAARAAGRQLDITTALSLGEQGVEEAEQLGQLEIKARAWLIHAALLRGMDFPYRASEASKRAFDLAQRTDVLEYQARAFRSQAAEHHYQREYERAIKAVRKSVSLWVRIGDRSSLHWTQLMEVSLLIEAGLYHEATATANHVAAQQDLQRAQKGLLHFLRAQMEWCAGESAAALERLRAFTLAAAGSNSLYIQMAKAEMVFLAIELGHLHEAAQLVSALIIPPTAGCMERRQAAVALARGDRFRAIECLRQIWEGGQSLGIEGLLIAVDLGWLLLESALPGFEDPVLEMLFAHVLDYSEEAPEVRLFRAGYLLRQRGGEHQRAEWNAEVKRSRTLARRCPVMVTESYREALATRVPAPLSQLFSRVCR